MREAASAFCQKKRLNTGRQADRWATERLNIRTDIDISSTSSRVPCAALGDTRWFSVSRASEDVASPWARPPRAGVQRLCPLVRVAQGSPFRSNDIGTNAGLRGRREGRQPSPAWERTGARCKHFSRVACVRPPADVPGQDSDPRRSAEQGPRAERGGARRAVRAAGFRGVCDQILINQTRFKGYHLTRRML